MKKIFIGGYATSGSRLPVMLLEKAGYYVGKVNVSYDCGGNVFPGFAEVFSNWIRNKSTETEKDLKAFLDDQIDGRDSWVLKHGHLMLIVPKLKSWYPSSEFVLTVRHPADQILRWTGFPYSAEEMNVLSNGVLEQYAELHTEALKYTDLLWRLEDACFDTVTAIERLFSFAEISDDANKYVGLVEKSKTVGMYRTNPVVARFLAEFLGKLGYDPFEFEELASTPFGVDPFARLRQSQRFSSESLPKNPLRYLLGCGNNSCMPPFQGGAAGLLSSVDEEEDYWFQGVHLKEVK